VSHPPLREAIPPREFDVRPRAPCERHRPNGWRLEHGGSCPAVESW